MNKVILHGNLARDPDVKVVQIGDRNVTVANIVVAVSRRYRKANGNYETETTFVPCEAWDSGAKTIGDRLVKGSPVLIEGSLKMETWETDGQKRSRMKVRITNFDILYRKPSSDVSTNDETKSTSF